MLNAWIWSPKRICLISGMTLECSFQILPHKRVIVLRMGKKDLFYHNIMSYSWNKTVIGFINAANTIAQKLKQGKTVLLEGSRKNLSHHVILSLTQVLIDAHYRTIQGFGVLFVKDWVSVAYPFLGSLIIRLLVTMLTFFSESAGPGAATFPPYFELFIYCMAFLTVFHTKAFEFNSFYLETLLDESFNFRFSTFVYYLAKIRREASAKSSVLDYLMRGSQKFKNPIYKPVKGVVIVVCMETLLFLVLTCTLERKDSCGTPELGLDSTFSRCS